MKRTSALLVAMLCASLLAGPATSQQLAAADCFAIGQRIAAQRGGSLAAARAESRGGQQVCVIVVLVPGADGQRPRREEVVVPQ